MLKMHFLRTYFKNPLLTLYLCAIIRQFLWGFPNQFLAWFLSLIIAIILTNKISPAEQNKLVPNSRFWFSIIIITPLLAVYLIRFVFPDTSFDVLNYHLINSERALRGFPFITNDFLYIVQGNPLPDMITGLSRYLLGYRLGTVINLIVIILVAINLNYIAQKYISNYLKRYLLIISILFSTGILYEINNYMVDLLALPLIIEIFIIIIYQQLNNTKQYIYFWILCGIIIALKLTNITILVPVYIYSIFNILFFTPHNFSNFKKATLLALSIVIISLPLIPYSKYMYNYTRNPIYPLYNSIFKSPYWTETDFTNPWGPKKILDKISWPVLTSIDPFTKINQELPEKMIPFSVIILITPIIIFILFIEKKLIKYKTAIIMYLILFLSGELWGFTSGAPRYGLHFYLLSGILIFIIFSDKLSSLLISNNIFKLAKIIIIISLIVNILYTCKYINETEYSSRTHFFSNQKEYLNNIKYVLRDYNLISFQDLKNNHLITNTNGWLASSPVLTGYMALLNPHVPLIDITRIDNNGSKTMELYHNTVSQINKFHFISLVRVNNFLGSDITTSLASMASKNMKVISVEPFELRIFSDTPSFKIPLYIITTEVDYYPSKPI